MKQKTKKAKELGFSYGLLAATLEIQANEQGYTLGNKAEKLQSYVKAAQKLKLGIKLPDSVYHDILKRINKRVTESLTPLNKD